jgi:hypothetical protein
MGEEWAEKGEELRKGISAKERMWFWALMGCMGKGKGRGVRGAKGET